MYRLLSFMFFAVLQTMTVYKAKIIVSKKATNKKRLTSATKSETAHDLAGEGFKPFMNIELVEAYEKFFPARKPDADFTVALAFMGKLTNGETRKIFRKNGISSAVSKN